MKTETEKKTKRTPAQKAFVTRWIKNLESGKFNPGKHGLKYHEAFGGRKFNYCCLGVMCEMSGLRSISAGDPNDIRSPGAGRELFAFVDHDENHSGPAPFYVNYPPDLLFAQKTGFQPSVMRLLARINDSVINEEGYKYAIIALKMFNKIQFVEDLDRLKAFKIWEDYRDSVPEEQRWSVPTASPI